MGRESLYLQLLLVICDISLDQGCPTCGPLKVLMRPSDDFQFSGYNEGYEEEFCEIAERNLRRKSINKRKISEDPFFFLENT